jgi:hypothetical protein
MDARRAPTIFAPQVKAAVWRKKSLRVPISTIIDDAG